MNDGGLIDNEDLRSTRMRAREVRGEVLVGPERRRRWSVEEKLRILAQSVARGSSVMLVCRMHGISSGQLYTWRRQFRTGELTGFCAGDGGLAAVGATGFDHCGCRAGTSQS
jgi:transposase